MSDASVHFKKPTRKEQKAAREHEAWRQKILAEHADLRKQILALRPDWSPELLEEVRQTYGRFTLARDLQADVPGLYEILRTLQDAARLTSQFTKK
jgi:hypothetical protein